MASGALHLKSPATPRAPCESALDMMKRVGELQKQWQAEGKPHLDIVSASTRRRQRRQHGVQFALWLHGSRRQRKSLLASRGLNKDYGTAHSCERKHLRIAKIPDLSFANSTSSASKANSNPSPLRTLGRKGDSSTQTTDCSLASPPPGNSIAARLGKSATSVSIHSRNLANRRPIAHLLETLPGISLRRTASQLGRRFHHGSQVSLTQRARKSSQLDPFLCDGRALSRIHKC